MSDRKVGPNVIVTELKSEWLNPVTGEVMRPKVVRLPEPKKIKPRQTMKPDRYTDGAKSSLDFALTKIKYNSMLLEYSKKSNAYEDMVAISLSEEEMEALLIVLEPDLKKRRERNKPTPIK